MIRRWKLIDPATGETWTMPINPDGMTAFPVVARQFRHAYYASLNNNGVRTFQTPSAPAELQWVGWIRSQEQYDNLWYWAAKTVEVVVIDHLGRYYTIFIKAFEPEERAPASPRNAWRLRYRMTAVLLGVNEIHLGTAVEAQTVQPLS